MSFNFISLRCRSRKKGRGEEIQARSALRLFYNCLFRVSSIPFCMGPYQPLQSFFKFKNVERSRSKGVSNRVYINVNNHDLQTHPGLTLYSLEYLNNLKWSVKNSWMSFYCEPLSSFLLVVLLHVKVRNFSVVVLLGLLPKRFHPNQDWWWAPRN